MSKNSRADFNHASNNKKFRLTVVVDDLENVGAAGLVLEVGLQEEDEGEVALSFLERGTTFLRERM